jgi:Domain of unknown function (DUF4440)
METMTMKKAALAAILGISLAGTIGAQAITGEKADEVKKEILKIEDEKVAGLLRGGSEPVDWIRQYDAEEIAQTNIDGSSPGKAEIEAGLQPGVFKMHSMKQDGHKFRVYDDGKVAVVTYHALGVLERNGKITPRESNFSDVWVKQNGAWLRVLHAEREIVKKSGTQQQGTGARQLPQRPAAKAGPSAVITAGLKPGPTNHSESQDGRGHAATWDSHSLPRAPARGWPSIMLFLRIGWKMRC